MPNLSVNIDHVATLRQARLESFPDPVQAAAAVELGGADGITVHLRQDRRHITDRDVQLLRSTVKTELTVEMAGTVELARLMARIRPDQVTLVPEVRSEVTTTSGIDLLKERHRLEPIVERLKKARVRLSLFIEPDTAQVEAAARLGANVVELNTDRYSRDWSRKPALVDELARAAEAARDAGVAVHVGHALGYRNVVPILRGQIAAGYSIGFSIVARAVFVGLTDAVAEMKRIMEVYSCERC
ncbi:MAG TPA: pyridoxine 5'-phosphate synthase [bacterium]|nr:pyridoxine 5'-phosphate synthase [bacterium]